MGAPRAPCRRAHPLHGGCTTRRANTAAVGRAGLARLRIDERLMVGPRRGVKPSPPQGAPQRMVVAPARAPGGWWPARRRWRPRGLGGASRSEGYGRAVARGGSTEVDTVRNAGSVQLGVRACRFVLHARGQIALEASMRCELTSWQRQP